MTRVFFLNFERNYILNFSTILSEFEIFKIILTGFEFCKLNYFNLLKKIKFYFLAVLNKISIKIIQT